MRKLILLSILSIILGNYVLAYDFSAVCSTGQTLYYNITSDVEPYTVEVTSEVDGGYNTMPEGDLEIPETVEYNSITYSVTSIGDYAFYVCYGLTSITIPNSVMNFGIYAFSGCDGLTSVTIPNSVITIGDYAFGACSGLESIIIGSNVTNIGTDVFYSCSGLSSISVEGNNSTFDSRDNCNAIIQTETNNLLYGCKNTTIPSTVISIGQQAFYGSGLESISIPSSVTSIGGLAFYDCTNLTEITIPESITSIDGNVFTNCVALESIVVDGNNSTYDSRDNCNAIIETGTNTLIVGCKSTIIPNSITIIGQDAFSGSGVRKVYIPNSVTNIAYGAFYNCHSLTSVTIGNSVAAIGDLAFWSADNLTEINIFSTTPPALSENSFYEEIYTTATVWVPRGTIDIYRSAEYWTQFSNIREVPYYWSCDFENEEMWSFGNDHQDGNVQWQIVTSETYPSGLVVGTNAYIKPFVFNGDTLSNTPYHWAMVDIISQLTDLGGPGQVAENPYIEFSGIDLSDAEHPQLRFNQIYRRLNTVETLIRVSSNGGQTWVDHTINSEVESNEYGKYYYTKDGIDIFEAAGAQNVVIRFYMISEATTAQEGYGWEIDDIQIVEAPQCDLTLQDARISMFGYLDYRDEEAVSQQFPNMENPREYAYQLYDPYAQSPRMQWYSTAPSAAFNVEVSSYGYDTVTPMARVKITNPNGVEIYNKETSGIRALSTNEGDTVDFFNSDAFYFEGIESYSDIIIGRYTVDFYVYVDGMEDDDESDNHTTQYFDITNNTFSMSYDEPTGYYGYSNTYANSTSGDEYGVVFTYRYSSSINYLAVDAYIDEHTTVGTKAQLLIYDNDYVEINRSDTIVITSNMLGSWVNFPLNDDLYYDYASLDSDSSFSFMAAIKGIWNDGETFALGTSDVLTSKGHNCYMRLTNYGDSWYYNAPQLAIRVRPELTDSIVHWSCDFEGDEIWTFGNDQQDGNVQWQIVTLETYPATLGNNEIGYYFQPFIYDGDTLCDTPEHWALVDLVSQAEDLGGPGQVAESPYIEFSGIDLSDAEHPQLCFNQLYRRLNQVETLVRVSTDGGATWTDYHVNANEQSNSNNYKNIAKQRLGIFEAAGMSNVTIRFQMNGDGTSQGYGWQIDDIKIKETPAYDHAIQNARISMFGYLDYRDENALWGINETRETAYHKYDPYAQSPRKQWETENGFAAFNVEVANIGYEPITPMARITITNPNGEEIYNKVVPCNRSLSFAEIDTLDFVDENLFRFENDILTGRYNVDFYVFTEEGIEDTDTTDNHTSQYFDITENTFSMSYNEPTGYFMLDSDSDNEIRYGTKFTYYYDDFIQNIENRNIVFEAYIDEHTSVGAVISAMLHEYDGNEDVNTYLGGYETTPIEIDEDMLGTWINLGMNDEDFVLSTYENGVPYNFILSIKTEPGNGSVAIGTSDVLTSMGNNSIKHIGSGWRHSGNQLAIRVREISVITDSTVHWSCDFEEGSPQPSITGSNDSEANWEIITESDYPETMFSSDGVCYFLPMNYTGHPGNNDPHQQISETPEHWAYVNACSDDYMSAPEINTSMTFSNIDLSASSHPKITFKQSWRVLNPSNETISVETSIDGGMTWTSHVINDEQLDSRVYVNGYKEVGIMEAGGASNVAIRFNYTTTNASWTYGWQIDDIKIVEIPACDLKIKDARISMFGYTDYKDEDLLSQLYPGYDSAEARKYAYQSHDPYAQSPRQQWATESGYAAFNVEIFSYGYETITPSVMVKITNPNGDEIYNKVAYGIRPFSYSDSDTVDFFNSSYFYFEGIESYRDIITGRYTVDFYVYADGLDDADTTDNHTTQYFDVTENTYSTSYDEPTGYIDYNSYANSSSGDEYGTLFRYSYESEKDIIVEAYISRYCSVGVQAQAILYEDPDEYINEGISPGIVSSDTIVVTEDMFDSWVTFKFNNVPSIKFDSIFQVNSTDTLTPYKFIVGIKGMWNEGETFALGTCDVLTSKGHNCYMLLLNHDESWYYGAPQLAIRVRELNEYTVNVISSNEAYGSVSGGGTYEEGDTIIITAIPNGGYLFDSWEDDNFDNPRTITVTSDSTFIADFVKCEITQTIDTVVPNFVTVGDHTFYSTGRYSFEIQHEADCDTIFDINLTVLAEPESFDIEPNPAKSIVNIHSDKFISFVEFYSTTGQLVMRKEANGNFIECDVESLVSGIYIVRIYGEENNLPSVYKIVKE